MNVHPCLSCGACCAFFRVSFHWSEADDATPQGVPVALTTDWNSTLRLMKGTETKPPRCHALLGNPGERVACTIYSERPSPCREFTPSFENGVRNEACDKARAHYGLLPLTPEIWQDPENPLQPSDDPIRPDRVA